MKWLPIILALVFFKLTVLPSCESGSCCSETSQLTDTDNPIEEEGDCTSYCMCLHCGYITVIEQQSDLIDRHQDEISRVIPTYTESYMHHYAKSQWHPPLMG